MLTFKNSNNKIRPNCRVSLRISGDSTFSSFRPSSSARGGKREFGMGASRSQARARGSILSPPLFAFSIRQANIRTGLSKHPHIEKPDRFDPKLLLYSGNRSSYGPTTTRLAMKLRQIKGG